MEEPGPLPFKAVAVEGHAKPQTLVYMGLHADYSEDFFEGTTIGEQRAGELVVQRLLKGNKGHWGPLEHPSLSLMVRADPTSAASYS